MRPDTPIRAEVRPIGLLSHAVGWSTGRPLPVPMGPADGVGRTAHYGSRALTSSRRVRNRFAQYSNSRWVSARTIKETFVPPTDYRYPYMGGE